MLRFSCRTAPPLRQTFGRKAGLIMFYTFCMAYHIIIRFYEELNDFIKNHPPREDIPFSFRDRRSVKDLIESFGVPHVEVDLILVNGESVDFGYTVRDGDRISVYPVFERLAIDGLNRLRTAPLRVSRFVLDVHLGSLARALRMLGFDCDYRSHRDDQELARISAAQKRILLTRDRGLLKRKIVSRGLIVRHDDPKDQLKEILEKLDLKNQINPFTRCLSCNSLLVSLTRGSALYEELTAPLPQGVIGRYKEYTYCPSCRKVYWKGSHYDSMTALIKDL